MYADEINKVVKKTGPKKDWKGTGSTPMKIKLPPFKINVPTWPPITLPPYRVNLAPVGPIPLPEIKFEVPTIYPNHNTNIKWPTWPPITSGPIRINLPTWAPYSKDKKTMRITLRKDRKRPIVFGEPLNLPTWAPVKLPPFKVDVPTVYPPNYKLPKTNTKFTCCPWFPWGRK